MLSPKLGVGADVLRPHRAAVFETGPDAKRQFLSLIFENVWLEQDRVVAVQPKPSFLPYFERKEPGVKYGSDGGRFPSGHRIEIRV